MTKDDELSSIINAYNFLVKGIDEKAHSDENRAYGGIIRAGKGELTESIAKQLTLLSWKELGQSEASINVEKKVVHIPIKEEYIRSIPNDSIRSYIIENRKNYYYPLKIDWTVSITKPDLSGFQPVIGIECKAYTENAMLKRVLVDCSLLKSIYPNMNFILFQLESQLGGDYSEINKLTFGSPSTHTIFSYFDIDINIITLLKGERKVDKPIHKQEFFKPLTSESLENVISILTEILKKYV